MRRSLADPSYVPRTCLMDEVVPNRSYELVISVFHGGAFMRYRIGDVYLCLSSGSKYGPPRFTFVDRVPSVIDIAGFTRITESSIREVIRLSKLGIGDWLAKKEFGQNGHPFLHMYVEILPEAQLADAIAVQVLTEHLAAYFKYFDSEVWQSNSNGLGILYIHRNSARHYIPSFKRLQEVESKRIRRRLYV